MEDIHGMSCLNCGSAFHEKWACPKPPRIAEEAKSTAARKDVPEDVGSREADTPVHGEKQQPQTGAGTQAPPVDTFRDDMAKAFTAKVDDVPFTPKRGRPKTITDMKAYKAERERIYRARKKAKT